MQNDFQHDRDELDPVTRQALKGYRAPSPAPLEQMWAAIEHAHFDVERRSAYARWRRQAPIWLAAAATLVLGIGIGRFTVHEGESHTANPQLVTHEVPPESAQPDLPPTAAAASSSTPVNMQLDVPYEVATNRYLGETAALLAVLSFGPRSAQANANFDEQANDLLLTTRMLLDSPAAADPNMQGLLSDLELVLAQVVSLQPDRSQEQMLLLAEAMKQRDVMPRLENAVVRVSQDF